ncbi:hypothetical protein ASPWEDRAFT_186049 [Aspergillus wentii DTO 134E9]|uniref:Uncharacterized protein n=1 Tax=Aspergillus wentii DTO 134E9 TaxID=1073089 RepID=A0A1L9RA54_ASPWE|nr:uncharacterized protein ASPWEDRAFT_186049 [Aspergillus wentii DTO 134E9]OJJ31790.1 hypothetical protein ASPWEDRAFT_186049 [Aspergillus wentii DTO 134E9]
MRKSNVTGKKRPAEGDLDGDQPLAKKFGHLHIDSEACRADSGHRPRPAALQTSSPQSTDVMLLDDTRDTVYIHDLDREIADVEDQQSVTFLPGIPNLGSVPRVLLTGPRPQGNELILYRGHVSPTVPKEQNSMQKTIDESIVQASAEQNGDRGPYTGSSSGMCKGAVESNQTMSASSQNKMCNISGSSMDIDIEL